MNIMIVDDERPAIDQLVDLLRDTGKSLHIHTFQNSKEAISQISTIKPDLLYLDIEMPGLTGISFAEQLLEQNTPCKVVFVTAYEQYALAAFDVMAMDYLLKPVDKDRLVRTLERVEGSSVLKHDADESVKVSMFGNFKVECAAGRVVFNTAKAEELLAYLILKQEASIHQIMEDLFADFDLERARWYVHTCLYQIRASLRKFGLEKHIQIAYHQRKYVLILEGVNLDLDLFDSDAPIEEKIACYQGSLFTDMDAMWKLGHVNYYEDCYRELVWKAWKEAENAGNLEQARKYKQLIEITD